MKVSFMIEPVLLDSWKTMPEILHIKHPAAVSFTLNLSSCTAIPQITISFLESGQPSNSSIKLAFIFQSFLKKLGFLCTHETSG
jgi:hypothetical protein